MNNSSHKIIFVAGTKGTGKTYLSQKIARAMYTAGRRVFVVSPHGDIRVPGASLVRKAPELLYKLGGQSVLIIPESDYDVTVFLKFIWNLQGSPSAPGVWLFIDELPMYLDSHKPIDALLRLVRYGRNRRVSLVGTSQRMAGVHKDFIANADIKILFRVQEVNDLAYLKGYVGPEVVRRLPSLADRRYIRVG